MKPVNEKRKLLNSLRNKVNIGSLLQWYGCKNTKINARADETYSNCMRTGSSLCKPSRLLALPLFIAISR